MTLRKTLLTVVTLPCLFWTLAGGQSGPAIIDASGVKGGLVVCVNFTDANILASLQVDNRYLVQGLSTDMQIVEQARRTIAALGKYGPVSVDRYSGGVLPYDDNMVDLVVSDNLGSVTMTEVNRVLSPRGVAYIAGNKTVKPYPAEMDEWTHHLHSPDNNAVSRDLVAGPPRYLRFMAEPKTARDHEHLATMSESVTGNGRIFSIVDKASASNLRWPAQWYLVARDAFNGKFLWEKPISKWASVLRKFKLGPTDLHHRMAVQGDTLYATLGLTAPVVKINAPPLLEKSNCLSVYNVAVSADWVKLCSMNQTTDDALVAFR